MAIETERLYAVDDDPMRAAVITNGRPAPAIADPAPLGLAGMWEFRRGNTFGAAVFGSFGAFWLSYWLLEQFFAGRIPGAERSSAIALFYISWAILAALLWVASTRTTAVISLTLFLLTLSFLMLGIGDAGSHTELVKLGGWFGLASAVAGLYAAFASVMNSTVERTLMPLVPLRRAHR